MTAFGAVAATLVFIGVHLLTDSRLAVQVAAYLFFVAVPFGVVIDGLRTGVIFWPQTGMSESRSDGWWFWIIAVIWVCVGVFGFWLLRT